jgi:glycosyltransferase involved in cell wall biosynthesis
VTADGCRRTLALLPWGLVLEDFLAPNRLSLDDFCADFTGSWMFGYANALRTAGVETVIVCVSTGVDAVARRIHGATGTPICVLPVPRPYRLLRSRMQFPYGRTVAGVFGGPPALRRALYPLLFAAKEAAPFLATPVRALARELRRYGCDAVLCQEYEFPRFDVCVALGRLVGLPVYASFQGGDYQRWRLERLLRPLSVRLAAGLVIAPQAEVERVRARYRPRRVACVPNPLDLELWRPHDRAASRRALGLPEEARVAAWHGRVDVWKKGLDTLLDAWALVCSDGPGNRVLLLLGTGADADQVRACADGHGLRNVVWIDRYLHDPAEIARLLGAADVYAFTSRHEGFPLAPVEAMACGLPVVATDVSGIRDVLADGERSGGIVVPPDRPEQFARELGRLLDDAALRQALGPRARARAEEYGAASIGLRLRSFLFDRGGED